MDSQNICRLCLEVCPALYTLIKEEICTMIENLTSLKIIQDEGLPQFSCSRCILNLYFADHVRKKIIESDNKLRNLLRENGNFDELLEKNKSGPDTIINEMPIKTEIIEPTRPQVTKSVVTKQKTSHKKIVQPGVVEPSEEAPDKPEDFFQDRVIIKKGKTKYHCTVCNIDFVGYKILQKHRGLHLKKTCELCGKTMRLDNYKKHKMIHQLGPQICHVCGSNHKSFESLRSHMFRYHSKKRSYTCEDCGRVFDYISKLHIHKRKDHLGLRPHICDICAKDFSDITILKKHIRSVHDKVRDHVCKYCKKGFSSSNALKVHTRQHTDETPYLCELCNEGFRQRVSLKTHLKSKHGVCAKEEQEVTIRGNNSMDRSSKSDDDEQSE